MMPKEMNILQMSSRVTDDIAHSRMCHKPAFDLPSTEFQDTPQTFRYMEERQEFVPVAINCQSIFSFLYQLFRKRSFVTRSRFTAAMTRRVYWAIYRTKRMKTSKYIPLTKKIK